MPPPHAALGGQTDIMQPGARVVIHAAGRHHAPHLFDIFAVKGRDAGDRVDAVVAQAGAHEGEVARRHHVAHGDARSSKVVGRAIEDIKLPPGTNIGAIVRSGEVIIAHHDTVIQADDHIILFVVDKDRIPDVERLFQVGVTFL